MKLIIGGLLIYLSLFTSNVNAQTVCKSGLGISKIVNSGPQGYSCELGGLTYTFYDNLTELESPYSAINFQDFGAYQKIIFTKLSAHDTVAFNYHVISPIEIIEKVEMEYVQDPLLPIPYRAELFTTPSVPIKSSEYPIFIDTIIDPDTSVTPPYQTLLSITHTIYKTPAPLPLIGVGFAFGASRKIRKRISISKTKDKLKTI